MVLLLTLGVREKIIIHYVCINVNSNLHYLYFYFFSQGPTLFILYLIGASRPDFDATDVPVIDGLTMASSWNDF